MQSDETTEAGALASARARVEQARTDVAEAETRLEAVLADLRVSPRAEKVVSAAIEEALERRRHARKKLTFAEEIASPSR